MTGGSITTLDTTGTSAAAAYGVAVQGSTTTSRIELHGTSVLTVGPFAVGFRANSNATGLLDGATIHTQGANANGALALAGARITIQNGSSIFTDGAASSAVSSRTTGTSSSRIDVSNSHIRTLGSSSSALIATSTNVNAGAFINATDATVETFGDTSHGAHANFFGSTVALVGGTITTHGTGARGVSAENDALVSVTGTAITTTGQNAPGAYAFASSVPTFVRLTDAAVTTNGAGSRGLWATTRGAIVASGTAVTTTGAGAPGLFTDNAGTIDFSGQTITTHASTAPGISFGPTGPGGVNNVTLSNATVNAAGDGILAAAGINNLLLSASTINALSGIALNVTSSTGTSVIADATTINGRVSTALGSVSNLTLRNNTLWNMTGSSNVTNLVNDNSLIAYSAPAGDPALLASYKTLTASNYTGANGTIGLNTYLGGSASPSDRLIINGGSASGTSFLRVTNTTGPGALTTDNGILVVNTTNGGTTAANAFALGGPVVAGPYEYTLYRSSVDATNPQAWYLRSTLNCSAAGAPSPPCPAPTPPTPPPVPPTPPTPPTPVPVPPVPNYRAETSLYAALPAMVLGYGRNLIDTLHERVGEEQPGVAPGGGQGLTPTLGWARFVGLKGTREGSPHGIYGDGPKYGYDIVAFQGGLDLYRAERIDGGRDHAGIYAAVGQITADVTHFNALKVGKNTIDAYSLGAYWTRFAPSGWYLDAVAQFTWNDAKAVSRRLPTFTPDGSSLGVSLETGYPIPLGGGWQIEPQAQLIYQRAWLGSTTDGAATVRFTDAESLAGRVGARFLRSWALDEPAATPMARPRMMTAWLRPNLWYEFFGDPKTEFSSATGFIPFRANLRGGWVELNAGIDAQVFRNVSLVANAGYQWGLDGRSEAYNGKLGLRVNW